MKSRAQTSLRLSAAWLALAAAAAVAAPWVAAEAARQVRPEAALAAPSPAHWLGTDSLGRDLAMRLVSGATASLGAGVLAVLVAVLVGAAIGAAAGYHGGWCERVLMTLTDVMLCFPSFFLILAVIAVLGPGLVNVVVVIGLTGWMGTARLVRGEISSLKHRPFVMAARAMGMRGTRVIVRHLLPNAAGPVIVNAVLGISTAILLETGLSFLGIGVQPPTPSWGNILTDGKESMGVAWWLVLFPGAAIFLTSLSVNVIGEELHRRLRGEEVPRP